MVIDNIIFDTSLSEIIKSLKIELENNNIDLLNIIKDKGDDIQVQCPFHKGGHESNCSAGIRKTDGVFHCFTCNRSCNLPYLISYCFGKDDMGIYGLSWLKNNFLNSSIENRSEIKIDLSRDKKEKEEIKYISEEELDSYRYIHPYMYERKLNDKIIEMFDIGYDISTKSITFPIRDITGNTIVVARRRVDKKYFNYPKDSKKPVYGIYELSRLKEFPKEIIICESMLDALVCWVYGKYAVAMNGLGTEEQFEQLRDLPCRKYILATDNDEAGMNARKRLKRELKNKLISEYILPNNKKDLNDLTREEFDHLQESIF